MSSSLLAALLLACPARAGLRVYDAQIAVVIDDFGKTTAKNPQDVEWMSFDQPMTFAVMPEAVSTQDAARATLKAGKELIIHFPFDPFQMYDLRPGKATPADVEKMRWLLEDARKTIPGAVGLNNHKAVKATMNRPLMREFMRMLKPTGLFFVDSAVSSMTVAGKVARSSGLRTTFNYRFLDTEEEHTQEFCAKMLAQAVDRARKKGQPTLVIGHHYFRTTLDCLKAEMPRYEKEGVEFIHASAAVH